MGVFFYPQKIKKVFYYKFKKAKLVKNVAVNRFTLYQRNCVAEVQILTRELLPYYQDKIWF